MLTIGVDLGGTKIAAGIVRNGKVIKRVILSTDAQRGKEFVIGQLRSAISQLSGGKKVVVGIGVPGTFRGTRLLTLPNVRCLEGVDLAKALRPVAAKVLVENDARCALLAEARFGAGKNKRHQILIILGTGVGTALMIDGKLYCGAGKAAEGGHQVVNLNASSFAISDKTDWEWLLSGPGMVRRHTARGGKETMPSSIWSSQSSAARATREETIRLLAIFIANLQITLDPEVIILSGGLSHLPLASAVNKVLPQFGGRAIVKNNLLGDDAGIIGATLR